MSFNNQILFQYILEGNVDQAIKYVIDHVPDYLFKYYSLSEDSNNSLDFKKLNTLRNNSNWFDLHNNQNDPLDMKMAYVCRDCSPNATESQLKVATELMKTLSDSMLLCSFLDSDQFNLPMWFAYSNNHKGYCIKYKINKKQIFWKVLYNEYRMPVLSIPLNLLHEMKKSDEIGSETALLKQYRYIMHLILNTKHSSWKHENEYRILYPNEKGRGQNISNNLLGLIPTELYVGLNCISEYKNDLKIICRDTLKCKCFQAFTSQSKILDFKEL
ncbi:MAG: DUF2971 domain-containing protein [Clostridiales bacterium]|nr:DUF2971 domain-containing protein [Clostridiales bacterium]